MTNHQGGMGELNLNCIPNNENEVNPHSSGPFGLLPFAISPTGGDQRFPNWVSGSNHSASIFADGSNFPRFPDSVSGSNLLDYQPSHAIVPSNNDRRAGVFPHSDAEFAGNNHYNNLNVSLGLCLHPNGPENQNINNSSTTVIDSGLSRYVVEEQGMDGSSLDVRRLSGKRRLSPEHSFREFLVGESSSMAAQAGNPKRRAYDVNANNNSLNISIPEQFETGIGHGTTIRPFSDMQHLNESGQLENFQSNNIHLHGVDQQASLHPGILSSGYSHLPFYRSSETPFGAFEDVPSLHPFEDVPNFHETSQDTSSFDTMSPIGVHPSFSPAFTALESGPVVNVHCPIHTAGNNMLAHEIGMGNWAQIAGNLSFLNGDSPYPSHSNSASGINLPNALTWAPRFNFAENMDNPIVASFSFPMQSNNGHSDSNSPAMSQEIDFSFGFGNAVSQNQTTSEERSENQAVGGNHDGVYSIWSSVNSENRTRLMIVLRSALQHLRNGGSLRYQDFIMLDHSIMFHLLGDISEHDEVHLDVENMGYEDLIALEEHIGDVENGLSEEAIVSHLKQEKFQIISEGSTTENESCCICQEEYNENEDLGKLDCDHRFHVDCIKPWLMRKNTCPICKQIALAAAEEEDDAAEEDEDDDDEDEDEDDDEEDDDDA